MPKGILHKEYMDRWEPFNCDRIAAINPRYQTLRVTKDVVCVGDDESASEQVQLFLGDSLYNEFSILTKKEEGSWAPLRDVQPLQGFYVIIQR